MTDTKTATSNENETELVTIQLEKWQIKYLLGALRLGINAEGWCANLSFAESLTADTHNAKYIVRIANVIETIGKQSGVTQEEYEYGQPEYRQQIDEWVASKVSEAIKQTK